MDLASKILSVIYNSLIMMQDGFKKFYLKRRDSNNSFDLQITGAPPHYQKTSDIHDEKAERPADVNPVPSKFIASRDDVLERAWRDVEDICKGYSQQEKAIIWKDRVRRIREQQKMFAARKLCLVLDLDHTLLNSSVVIKTLLYHTLSSVMSSVLVSNLFISFRFQVLDQNMKRS